MFLCTFFNSYLSATILLIHGGMFLREIVMCEWLLIVLHLGRSTLRYTLCAIFGKTCNKHVNLHVIHSETCLSVDLCSAFSKPPVPHFCWLCTAHCVYVCMCVCAWRRGLRACGCLRACVRTCVRARARPLACMYSYRSDFFQKPVHPHILAFCSWPLSELPGVTRQKPRDWTKTLAD